MDSAGWHSSKRLKVPENIEIMYLPPYSPEMNPVEKLWLWLRRHICRNRLYETLEELMKELERYICGLTREKIRQLCHISYLVNFI